MRNCILLLTFLSFSFLSSAQETRTDVQQKQDLLDSLLKVSDLIQVFSQTRSDEYENDVLLTASSWEFQSGHIQLNNKYFFDLKHLVWFKIIDHNSKGKILQLYFD